MIGTLVRKELREHWLALGTLSVLSGIGALLVLVLRLGTGEVGTVFEPFRVFLLVFGTLAAMTVTHALVTREYQGETQLFLEALPISRGAMVAVKCVLGFLMLLVVVGIGFGICLAVAVMRGQLTGNLAANVAIRTLVFAAFLYGVFFVWAFLGRYRIPLFLFAILSLVFLSTTTGLELGRTPPFAIVDDRFGYERYQAPLYDLGVTLVIALGLVGLGLSMALVREGSLAAMLAQRMSHREKVFAAIALLALVFVWGTYYEREHREPFDIPGAVAAESEGVVVKVAWTSAAVDVESLAELVRSELADLRGFLGRDAWRPVFVVPFRGMDGTAFETAEVDDADVMLVRVNPAADDWDSRVFIRRLVAELLERERPVPESKRWVRDGFPDYWMARQNGRRGFPDADRRLLLRALYGTREGMPGDDWLRFRERVGGDIADAVAWSRLETLSESQGEERAQAFLRAVLGRRVPEDVRSLLHEWKAPVDVQLEEHAGVSMEELDAAWRSRMETFRKEFAAALAEIPRVAGRAKVVAVSEHSRRLAFEVEVDPLPPDGWFRFLHSTLPPLDGEIPEDEAERETRAIERTREGELPEVFPVGSRVAWTFAVEAPTLGCEVISGWNREEIK